MNVVLHEGHEHAESASSTGSPELLAIAAIAVLLAAAIAWYALNRYGSE